MKTVTLICGDITHLSVDALVNSANRSLLGGSGLDYIIHKKAGRVMREACAELNKINGGCKTGHAEVTVAGELPMQFIIHVVGPRWLNGMHNEAQLLCDAYSNALIKAESIKAKSISFPNISTGVYGFPKKLAAEIAIGTILSNLDYFKEIEQVFFVCKEIDNYKIYKELLLNIQDNQKMQIII